MVEYVGDILGISVRWLTEEARLITKRMLIYYVNKGKIQRLVRGGRGREAMVSWESLPDRLKEAVIRELGKSPYEFYKYEYFKRYYGDDEEAREFYSNYMLSDGRYLSEIFDKRRGEYYSTIYYQNAKMLNAVGRFYTDLRGRWKAMGGKHPNIWENLSELVNYYRDIRLTRHWLPQKARPLQRKWNEYEKGGYEALISKKFQNSNAKKVDERLERLLMSMYVEKHKPYKRTVYSRYIDFLNGKIEVIDRESGEIFRPEDFSFISEATLWRILEDIPNKLAVYQKRNDSLSWQSITPHKMTYKPEYSLSLFTLDDRDLPMQLHSGKHPKVYLAYDVKSQALVGWALSESKNEALVAEMFRSMFRRLESMGLGIPYEIQVEHHLIKNIRGELEEIFPFVHFAPPGRAQSKYAERLNHIIKYEFEKYIYPFNVGRHWAKREADRIKEKVYWDAEGMQTKAQRYSMGQVRSMFRKVVEAYNNDEHPEIKGKSRLDVLKEYATEKVLQMPRHIIAKHFGYKAKAKQIRRNQYVKVSGQEWWLESPELLEKLEPGNYKVDVYYLPDESGNIEEVYIWQGEKYIGRGVSYERFNMASVERKKEDLAAMEAQEQWMKKFRKMQRENRKKAGRVVIAPNEETEEYEILEVINNPEIIPYKKGKAPEERALEI